MSRPKLSYQPGQHWRNTLVAAFGIKFRRELQIFVADWQDLLDWDDNGGKPLFQVKEYFMLQPASVSLYREGLTRELVAMLKRALQKSNGNEFRALADFIEGEAEQADKGRSWLLDVHDLSTGGNHSKQRRFFTCRQLVAMAKERIGWTVSERRMRTICAQLGIRPREAPKGAPRKPHQKTRNSLKR